MESLNPTELIRLTTEGGGHSIVATAFDEIPSGVFVAEPSGRILFCNDQFEDVLGFPATLDASGWRGHHPDGREYVPGDWPGDIVLATGQPAPDQDIEIARPDSRRAIVRMSARPVHKGGELTAIVVVCTDITQQRRRFVSRRFLADAGSLLSATADPIVTLRNIARLAVPTLADWCTIDLVDDDGQIERVAIEHIDRRKAQAAKALARRQPPSADATVGVAEVIRSGRAERIHEVTEEVLDSLSESPGHQRLLRELGIRSVMIVPLKTRGIPIGAITLVSAESGQLYTSEDLDLATELAGRAALAIENSRLFDESRAATEAKSDFLAVMSHELRTPLTAIIGYAELLQMGVPEPVTPRQHEQAERIEVSARHLLQLIEEILTLVTLDSGEEPVRKAEVATGDFLDRVANIMEPMARAKSLRLQIDASEQDVVIRTDADKLLQIILNLVSNAIKFTEEGEVRVGAVVEDGDLAITIADTGVGLDPEHLQRIFEPFWQVERPITRRAGGTGLGLALSRRLAELIGAEIELDSELGEGSRFIVRVPLG